MDTIAELRAQIPEPWTEPRTEVGDAIAGASKPPRLTQTHTNTHRKLSFTLTFSRCHAPCQTLQRGSTPPRQIRPPTASSTSSWCSADSSKCSARSSRLAPGDRKGIFGRSSSAADAALNDSHRLMSSSPSPRMCKMLCSASLSERERWNGQLVTRALAQASLATRPTRDTRRLRHLDYPAALGHQSSAPSRWRTTTSARP